MARAQPPDRSGRAVGVEALDVFTPHAWPLRALGLGPDDRLVLGVEDEVAAGRDLDAVAAGLEAVEEEALGDRVLGGRRLDRDVVVEEQVGGAQALLARVDPEGEVVQAPARAVGVGGVDQLVRGDRQAQPGPRLGAVVELDPLVAGDSRAAPAANSRLARTSAARTLTWSRRLTAAPRPT